MEATQRRRVFIRNQNIEIYILILYKGHMVSLLDRFNQPYFSVVSFFLDGVGCGGGAIFYCIGLTLVLGSPIQI